MPLILGGLFFLAWAVAVIFAVGETYSRAHEKIVTTDAALSGGSAGTGGRYPILDRNRHELAVSFPMKSVYARPLEVEDPEAAARFLARELGVDEKRLQRDFREERGFFWLGRQIPAEAGNKIREANLPGVYVVDESQRYYPQDFLAAHVVGFVGEGHGLAGIEARYDRQLRGMTEPLLQETGSEAPAGPLVLTLDLRAQELLEKQLAQLVQTTSAAGGCGLLLEAGAGEILAMASNPAYDPNFFWEYEESDRVNRVETAPVAAAGFRNLFRLAALFQNGSLAESGNGGESAPLTALKVELKLASRLEKGGEHPARLVRQGARFISPALANLEELAEAADFASFIEELGMVQKPLAEAAPEKTGQPVDSFRPTGFEMLAGLAALLNPNGLVAPHLLAGVLDESTGQLRLYSHPVESLVRKATAEKMRDYFRGLPGESGGVKVLEELTPVIFDEEPPVVSAGMDMQGKEKPSFATLLVALAGGEKSPPLLLLLALDQARLDPASRTPMSLAAEKILPRAGDWVVEKPSTIAWKPRENKWRAEWQNLQTARAVKSRERARVDRRQMPDLQGLSLRKALQVLNRYDLKVRVQGSGRVAGQQPGAGAVINGDQCLLVLAGLK